MKLLNYSNLQVYLHFLCNIYTKRERDIFLCESFIYVHYNRFSTATFIPIVASWKCLFDKGQDRRI